MERKLEIISLVQDAVKESLTNEIYDLFIFGSQANQQEFINADIDIGIKSNGTIDNSTIARIKYELNKKATTLFTFDLIDFSNVTEEFKSVALLNIEKI